jgi:hypothetical protein
VLLKTVCAALILSLFFAVFSFGAAGVDETLRFRADGTFRILQIADCQDDEKPNSNMIGYIKAALRDVRPDLVVFTGDNIMGDKCEGIGETIEAIRAIVKPVADAGVPFTLTFGNHDNEGGISNFAQLGIYQGFSGCLAGDEPGLVGTGNHNLPIYKSANAAELAYNLWFFDSGNDADDSYFTSAEDDARNIWYLQKSAELKAQNGGNPVPSMAFQHIIFPGVYEHFFKTASPIPTVRIDEYLQLDNNCPPAVTRGQFDAFLTGGDVRAAVFGHYHMTDSVSNLKGIDIIQTPGASFSAYGHAAVRGVRVIELNEDSPDTYATYVWKFADHQPDSGTEGMSFWQRFMQMLRNFWDSIKTVFKFGA